MENRKKGLKKKSTHSQKATVAAQWSASQLSKEN